jgi:nitroimidazol reductase NimA-like FMN-containing flavoprotein (pyridoxamine 5'-phosphate oxidase superfamily)
MPEPAFFVNDVRRRELAWTDWDEVSAWLADQVVCRIAVNDGEWPYVVAQTFRFRDDAFLLHFGRNGRLANALRADPHCTVEVDQIVSLLKAPRANNTSAEYRSVVARCVAEMSEGDEPIEAQQHLALEKFRPEADFQPIDRIGATRRIVSIRARIEKLTAKKRILDEGGNPAGLDYARYAFPPPAAISQLAPEAFKPRFDREGNRL